MHDMRINFKMASVAIAFAAALAAATASPAQAGSQDWKSHRGAGAATVKAAALPRCTITPATVNLYTESRDFTFDVPSTTDQWVLDSTLFGAADPTFTYDDGFTITPTWTFDPTLYANSEAGSILVDVYTGADLTTDLNPYHCLAPFSLKRGSKISAGLKVSGDYRTVSGVVSSASWGDKPKYTKVNSGIVDVQKKLNGAWVTKKTVKTNSSGAYSAKIKAASGEWQAVFRGTTKIGSRTSATAKG